MSALNAEGTIAGAIRSICAQTFEDWELIVIDDGSSDHTFQSILEFKDARIRAIRHDVRAGLAVRLNEAVGLARGRYIARMDADDVAYPDRLIRQFQFMDAHPSIDLCGAAVMAFREAVGAVGVMQVAEVHDEICAHPESGFALAHPTWFGREGFFRRFPYDAKAMRAQDQDVLLRACTSARFANLSEVLLAYRQESVTLANLFQGRRQYVKSMQKVWGTRGQRRRLLRGAAHQAARAALVAPLLWLGMEEFVLSRRYRAATAEEHRAWMACMVSFQQSCASAGGADAPPP